MVIVQLDQHVHIIITNNKRNNRPLIKNLLYLLCLKANNPINNNNNNTIINHNKRFNQQQNLYVNNFLSVITISVKIFIPKNVINHLTVKIYKMRSASNGIPEYVGITQIVLSNNVI